MCAIDWNVAHSAASAEDFNLPPALLLVWPVAILALMMWAHAPKSDVKSILESPGDISELEREGEHGRQIRLSLGPGELFRFKVFPTLFFSNATAAEVVSAISRIA